jgi:hypothetical protein
VLIYARKMKRWKRTAYGAKIDEENDEFPQKKDKGGYVAKTQKKKVVIMHWNLIKRAL